MTAKEFLIKTGGVSLRNVRANCADGFSISIQASDGHYCIPREILVNGEYKAVELGFPSEADDLIAEYAEDKSNLINTVYGYVPIDIVETLVSKHGGIV